MLRTVHLHGKLKKRFGASHRFDVTTASEALRALNCAFPGRFIEALREGSYKLVRGDRRSGMQLDLDLINQLQLGHADLHLIPVAKGAASQTAKGTTKVILGAALVGGAIFLSGGTLATPLATSGLLSGITYGNVALVGVGLALTGVSTLLAKPATSNPSATNTGNINTGSLGNSGQQGNAVPLIYGEVLCGTTPISVASDVEDIDVYADIEGSIEAAFNTPAYGGRG
jgi:predicted phage tail protein